MKQLLKYSFSICFLLSLLFVQAQEKTTTEQGLKITETKNVEPTKKNPEKKLEATATDTIKPKTDRYGLIIGADINKIARSLYDSDYNGIAFTADYR